jgi:hypothetical protein
MLRCWGLPADTRPLDGSPASKTKDSVREAKFCIAVELDEPSLGQRAKTAQVQDDFQGPLDTRRSNTILTINGL